MNRRPSGLWVAHGFNINRFRRRAKVVTLPNGERANVTVDDSGTVCQIETGDTLGAVVSPAPIHIDLRTRRPKRGGTQIGGFALPGPIRIPFRNPQGRTQ